MAKIGDLFIKLGLQKGEFDKGIDDAKKKTSAFGSAMKSIGGMIAGVFAVDRILQFGKEVFQIAMQAEGVATAFSKIGSAGDLDNLRKSVKGTVSDLELMKRSVMASNFGIPVQELGKLFEFASKRAQDTGQSVDYLVDSIVTGIGRKSPLILDNLGISAIQLKEKLGSVTMEAASVADITRAVGKIAEESLNKTGRLADNLGTKVQSLAANWANLKMTISSLFSESDMIKKDLDDWSKLIQIWQSKELTKWEKFLASFSGVQADKVFERMQVLKGLQQEESSGGPLEKPNDKPIKVNETIKKLLEDIATKQKELNELPKKSIAYYEAEIALLQQKQKLITNPLLIEKSKTEIALKQDMLDQLTKELKLVEQIKMSNKDIADVFSKGIKTDKEFDTTKLVMSPSVKTRVQESENASEVYDSQIKAAQDFTDELNQIIQSGITSAIETLTTGLTELAMGEISGKEFGSQILSMVGNFMIQLGTAFIVFSKLFIAFQEAISTMNGPLALGIGIALVGAGAAISAVAKKGMSGGGSTAVAPASGYSSGYMNQSSAASWAGNVVFELDGYKLKGALNNADRRNTLIR